MECDEEKKKEKKIEAEKKILTIESRHAGNQWLGGDTLPLP